MKAQGFYVFVAGLLLASCAVGPNYKRPPVNSPATFRDAGAATNAESSELAWWQVYPDETLQALVRQAFTNNYDLRIAAARVIMLAVPIYNYDANAAVKNLIELTGSAWEDKIVGFACAAGGQSSYMSIIGLANSLMLDFRCIILAQWRNAAAFRSCVHSSPHPPWT